MIIEKTSILTGRKNVMEIDISENRYNLWERSQGRILIQEAFPDLSIEEHEFLISGITSEEWMTHIGSMDENEIEY